MRRARPTDQPSGAGRRYPHASPRRASHEDGRRVLWARLGLLAFSALVAIAAGLVTRVRWDTEPTADLAALLVHLGVVAVGVGGMLGVIPLPRGRRSGLGLALMATSMLVLFAAPASSLGPLATAGFLAAFVPGLWLVAGPGGNGQRLATRSPSEMPTLSGNDPPAPTGPAA
ncbi:MAG: hypothetical protein M0Z42_16495 [Actinomycetota bacterium]|jgi:hypothetical protein|nr:hypothetical protein [Actinomycetota bacterium]